MEALAECILEQLQSSGISIDTIYLVPAVRDYMERFTPKLFGEDQENKPAIQEHDQE